MISKTGCVATERRGAIHDKNGGWNHHEKEIFAGSAAAFRAPRAGGRVRCGAGDAGRACRCGDGASHGQSAVRDDPREAREIGNPSDIERRLRAGAHARLSECRDEDGHPAAAETDGGADGGIPAHPEAAAAANPINYIWRKSAPILLMHGTADTVVSPSETDLLYQALQNARIPSERYLVENAQHGGVYWVQDKVLDIITNFFDRYLKNDGASLWQ